METQVTKNETTIIKSLLRLVLFALGGFVSLFLFVAFFVMFPLFYLTTFCSLLVSATRLSILFLIGKYKNRARRTTKNKYTLRNFFIK